MKTTSSKVARISDKSIVNDLAGRVFSASRRKQPIIIAFFYYIFKFLLSVGAYVPRAIFRKKLGERTFGVITVLSVYLFFAFVQISVDAIPEGKKVFNQSLQALNIDRLNWESGYSIGEIYLILTSTNQGEETVGMLKTYLLTSILKNPILKFHGLLPDLKYLYWIVLLFSFFHFIEVRLRKNRDEIIHSYHRGKSLFNWLAEKRIFGVEIKERYLWMILEPGFIYVLAIGSTLLPGINTLPLVLKISAACLFLEEYRVFIENRSMLLDVIDSQMDGMKLAQVQAEYMERLGEVDHPENRKVDFPNVASID
ncbi:hypothetical protein [Flavilitoribacter nigricans]|uniref:Uncharacterized protein n=1 Tax=Flavilitoribacter nigricans (strain ATCC 23147 / DSM 23189 / NBRC 102662 / NCIMB 1420 / SS-2) TaxID=1122177 RepID=A0A2D0N782_FLAN2|nr:hypothetical protein [Flavilitoribacter nigricans]PHN04382.1 hypothetical protein CRP01_22755 [Flavilitoribacter nigricans DSM 23189 = NBRC 102662]